jgi:hypothetical protein
MVSKPIRTASSESDFITEMGQLLATQTNEFPIKACFMYHQQITLQIQITRAIDRVNYLAIKR